MKLFVPPRVDADELLDGPDAPREAMERSLRDLRRFNRYFGGTPAYRRLLAPFLQSGASSILDIGTGTSDLLLSLSSVRSLLRIGLDFRIEHLRYGALLHVIDDVRRVAGDGFRLPFRTDSVDLITSSHFFHHFSAEENAAMLTESLRVARTAVVITDTRRHHAPLLLVKILGLLRLVGEITRIDAPASVLRGYTPNEVRSIAGMVDGARFEVRRVFPYRFALILTK